MSRRPAEAELERARAQRAGLGIDRRVERQREIRGRAEGALAVGARRGEARARERE